jgi:hypothetical protein
MCGKFASSKSLFGDHDASAPAVALVQVVLPHWAGDTNESMLKRRVFRVRLHALVGALVGDFVGD